MERVLNERLQRFPFTSELTAFEDNDLAYNQIEPIARTILESDKGRRVKVSYENWEDEEEVNLKAVDAAVTIHEEISGEYNITKPDMKLPALPLDLEIPVNDPSQSKHSFKRGFFFRLPKR